MHLMLDSYPEGGSLKSAISLTWPPMWSTLQICQLVCPFLVHQVVLPRQQQAVQDADQPQRKFHHVPRQYGNVLPIHPSALTFEERKEMSAKILAAKLTSSILRCAEATNEVQKSCPIYFS